MKASFFFIQLSFVKFILLNRQINFEPFKIINNVDLIRGLLKMSRID